MKGKKPFVLAVLVVALLAVALILPAAATGKSDKKPTAWANWAQSDTYPGLSLSIKDGEGSYNWVPIELILGVEYPWKAALAVHAQRIDGSAVGHEVMNWQQALEPTITPPYKHSRTTGLLGSEFTDLGDGSYQARLLFCYNTEELGWPTGTPEAPLFAVWDGEGNFVDYLYVYHLWILTDNPGNEMDHVDLYSKGLIPDQAPDLGDDPGLWGGENVAGLGAAWIIDMDCHGVQVVIK